MEINHSRNVKQYVKNLSLAGIYIHIPFCSKACSYCNFYYTTQTTLISNYVDKLNEEIDYQAKHHHWNIIKSIYIGGGTPSLLSPKHLQSIFNKINQHFKLSLQEVTIEINPEDASYEYLHCLKELGITRLSIGIQSFDEKTLNSMNRRCNKKQILNTLDHVKKLSFVSFSVDFIYGYPNQSLQNIHDNLAIIKPFTPPHISAYMLSLEKKTALYKKVKLNRISMPHEEDTITQYHNIIHTLRQRQYEHYEISSFAIKGHQAFHNSNYWNHTSYLGLGPSAHSLLWQSKNDTILRWQNAASLKVYLDNVENHIQKEYTNLTKIDLIEEYFLLKLRTHEGISEKELWLRYNTKLNFNQKKFLTQIQAEGKLIYKNNRYCPTDEGMLFADNIALQLAHAL